MKDDIICSSILTFREHNGWLVGGNKKPSFGFFPAYHRFYFEVADSNLTRQALEFTLVSTMKLKLALALVFTLALALVFTLALASARRYNFRLCWVIFK